MDHIDMDVAEHEDEIYMRGLRDGRSERPDAVPPKEVQMCGVPCTREANHDGGCFAPITPDTYPHPNDCHCRWCAPPPSDAAPPEEMVEALQRIRDYSCGAEGGEMMDDRKVTVTHLSCGCDWNGKRWTYCAQHETAPPGVVKLGDLVRPTNSMGSGEVTLQQKLAPPRERVKCEGCGVWHFPGDPCPEHAGDLLAAPPFVDAEALRFASMCYADGPDMSAEGITRNIVEAYLRCVASDAAPVAWRFRTIDNERSVEYYPWRVEEKKPTVKDLADIQQMCCCDSVEVQPLYAHPEDAPGGPTKAELEQSFDLYHDAMRRGTKLWQEATGRVETLPDTAKLVAWLLDLVHCAEETEAAPKPVRTVYVASSWRNDKQPGVVMNLRRHGYEVYDFRNPSRGDNGFHWSEIDPAWQEWTPETYRAHLTHPLAEVGFAKDMDALRAADAVVLVNPCGRSAHLELAWVLGAGKPGIILLSDGEPELMYKMATAICVSLDEVCDALNRVDKT